MDNRESQRAALRQAMNDRLDSDEVRTASFDLGVSYDDLSGDTKRVRIISLIERIERTGRGADLIAWLRANRSDYAWPDPWSHIDELYSVNELVEAVVTRVTDFGAFVLLRSGVEGLLHVSEMADIQPDHPRSLVAPGDLLLLRVLRMEPARRRIELSLRMVSEMEWAEWAASYREKNGTKGTADD